MSDYEDPYLALLANLEYPWNAWKTENRQIVIESAKYILALNDQLLPISTDLTKVRCKSSANYNKLVQIKAQVIQIINCYLISLF